MKSYFEYPVDGKIKTKLLEYYNNQKLDQHSSAQNLKTAVKLGRLLKRAPLSESDRVLEIGCSRGYLLDMIKEKIKLGVGIDISEPIIRENYDKYKNTNLSFLAFDGKSIPLQKEFDKVLMIDVLEHAFEPDALLRESIRLLRPGGRLVIEVPFSGWLSETITRRYHNGHLRYYDPGYFSRYLQRFGFRVVHSLAYNSVPLASLFLKIKPIWKTINFLCNLIPPRLYPYFGEILVIAEKK